MCDKPGRRGWQNGFCRTHALQRGCGPHHRTMQNTAEREEQRNGKCKLCHKFARRGWQHGYCRAHALQEGYSPSSSPPKEAVELKSNTSKGCQRITSKQSAWQIMAKMDMKQRRQEETELEVALAEVQKSKEHQSRLLRTLAFGVIVTETHFDKCPTLPEQQLTCSWYKGHYDRKEFFRQCYCISS